jgi:hypothetical protein
MRFKRRDDAAPAAAWWRAVAEYPQSAPGVVRELLAGGSVVCDPLEGKRALAWAHPAWTGDAAPLVVENPRQ